MKILSLSGLELREAYSKPTVWYYSFTTNENGVTTATSTSQSAVNNQDVEPEVKDILRKKMGKKDDNYQAAVDRIRSQYGDDFKLKSGQNLGMHFSARFWKFQSDVYPQNGNLAGYMDFGESQFDDLLSGDESFGTLVRNIYHEYQHIQNGYATGGESNMNSELDEFKANYNTLTNTNLPGYAPAIAIFDNRATAR